MRGGLGVGGPGPISREALYSEVQCIVGNGHMGPPPPVDRQTSMKTLP